MVGMVMQVAGWVPVSDTLLADALPVGAWIHRTLLRRLTSESFDEQWSDVDHEMQRLEMGQLVGWDSLIYDDDDDFWWD